VHSKRQLIDGIRFRVLTGVPWRDLPARYGPWETVCGLFHRWRRDGTWRRILDQLHSPADARDLITWEVPALPGGEHAEAGDGSIAPIAGRCAVSGRTPRPR